MPGCECMPSERSRRYHYSNARLRTLPSGRWRTSATCNTGRHLDGGDLHSAATAPCGSGRRRRGPARRRPEMEEGRAAATTSRSVTWSPEEAQAWGRPERRRRRRSKKAGRRPCKLAMRWSRARPPAAAALGAPLLLVLGAPQLPPQPTPPWASVSAGGQAGERIRPGELGSAPSVGVALLAAREEEGEGGGGSGRGRSRESSPAARGLRGRRREEAWGRRAVEREGAGVDGERKMRREEK